MQEPARLNERARQSIEEALSITYGYGCMLAGDDDTALQNGLAMQSCVLTDEERDEVVRAINTNPDACEFFSYQCQRIWEGKNYL